jgi:NDP-sugar pyrophosphorylase family protein
MPIAPSTDSVWKVLYDHNKPLCFVGYTHFNKLLHKYFKKQRESILVSTDQLLSQSKEWQDQYQYICLPTHPKFKFEVKKIFDDLELDCFSVVSNLSVIGSNVEIGYSCHIDHFVHIWDDTVIKDHCTISAYVDLAHGTSMGIGCHISPYVQMSYVGLGNGVFVGSKSFVWADMRKPITVCDYVNVVASTRVLESIKKPGTYHGNRLIDIQTSLELDL